MIENITKCNTGIWFYLPFVSLVEAIQIGFNNIANSVLIRSNDSKNEVLLEIFIEENNFLIDTSKIKHPCFIINKKWEIIEEINFSELLIEIAIGLGDIEMKKNNLVA